LQDFNMGMAGQHYISVLFVKFVFKAVFLQVVWMGGPYGERALLQEWSCFRATDGGYHRWCFQHNLCLSSKVGVLTSYDPQLG